MRVPGTLTTSGIAKMTFTSFYPMIGEKLTSSRDVCVSVRPRNHDQRDYDLNRGGILLIAVKDYLSLLDRCFANDIE